MPLSLHPPEMLWLVRQAKGQQNWFCSLMASARKTCVACYALQQKLERKARRRAKTLTCFAGLSESAVPVCVGHKLVGFLHTGHALLHQPTPRKFRHLRARLRRWGPDIDLNTVKKAYFKTRVIPPGQYGSWLRLLEVFARHLAELTDEAYVPSPRSQPAAVVKARRFIELHYREKLPLRAVAQAVGLSASHLSRRFKETTGTAFVDYVARLRAQKAKALLQNSSLRIRAIAMEVGYQSVSQFNRSFKRVTGRTPKQLRRS